MSISLRSRIRRGFLLGCASGAALLVLAVGQASAATYPGGGSTFTGSAEGWTGKTDCPGIYAALNIPLLLCTSSAGYTGAAGNPAGSFNGTTEITLNLLQLFNSEEVAVSPNFTATAGGSGTLKLDRQFAPEGLLQLAPHVSYTAYLVDRSNGGSKQKAITETIEAASPFTTKSGGVTLIAGHTYAIEVVAGLGSSIAGVEGLTILGSTSFRFDNVSVTGPDPASGPNPPGCTGCDGGNNGSDGGNGGNGAEGGSGGGAGGVSSARLESLMQSSLVGPAVLKGNRLSVKAKCPAKVGTTCTISLQGMLNRHKPATVGRKAKVKQGKTKSFVLSVKAPARAKVKTKKTLLFKETVKAGKAKTTVWKTLKLVRK